MLELSVSMFFTMCVCFILFIVSGNVVRVSLYMGHVHVVNQLTPSFIWQTRQISPWHDQVRTSDIRRGRTTETLSQRNYSSWVNFTITVSSTSANETLVVPKLLSVHVLYSSERVHEWYESLKAPWAGRCKDANEFEDLSVSNECKHPLNAGIYNMWVNSEGASSN